MSNDLIPKCWGCGESIDELDEAVVILKGSWAQPRDLHIVNADGEVVPVDSPVFVLDPDTKLIAVPMPNGYLALILDQDDGPTQHGHQMCLDQLTEDEFADVNDDDQSEDFYEDIRRF